MLEVMEEDVEEVMKEVMEEVVENNVAFECLLVMSLIHNHDKQNC